MNVISVERFANNKTAFFGRQFLLASLEQRVDFPVSGENVCEADKRGLGVAER